MGVMTIIVQGTHQEKRSEKEARGKRVMASWGCFSEEVRQRCHPREEVASSKRRTASNKLAGRPKLERASG